MKNQTIAPSIASLAVLGLLLSASIAAQIPLSGNVRDGAGGPLLAGQVYHAAGSITVPAGQTLSVQAGAVVKFSGGAAFVVDGHLNVHASAANRAIFTSLWDDGAGGDTNGDGPSTGAPGHWAGLLFSAGADGSVTGLDLRFAGSNYTPAVSFPPNAGVSLVDSVVQSCFWSCLGYGGNGRAIVQNCSLLSSYRPVQDCPIDAVATFVGNSASGNSLHDSMEIAGTPTAGSFAINANNQLNGALILTGNPAIGAGHVVTIGPGVIFKLNGGAALVTVNGTLICNGTTNDPVVFTFWSDDAYAGDTNNDGPSSGVPGQWTGIVFTATATASDLQNVVVRYAGANFNSAVRCVDASPTLNSCKISHCFQAGLDLGSTTALPMVTNCDFQYLTIPIVNATFDSIQHFSGNTASNCSSCNTIVCPQATISNSISIGGDNLIGGVLAKDGNLDVASGGSLTLDNGAIIKMRSGAAAIDVNGTLLCQGSAGGEIVFTFIGDDAFGGDTDAGGASSGAKGQWRGLRFYPGSDASVLTNTRVRWAGSNFAPALAVQGADIRLQDCVVENAFQTALSLVNVPANPTVTGCSFDGSDVAVDGVLLSSLPGFVANTATGNTTRDCIRVTGGSVAGAVAVVKDNQINGVLEILGNVVVDPGAALTLGRGTVFKFSTTAALVSVSGTLTCDGTSAEPVVFTSIHDDDHAGDTDLGGASAGFPGHWTGIHFGVGSAASRLEHALVRYAGANYYAGLDIAGGDISLTDSTIERCYDSAIGFSNSTARPTIARCRFDQNAQVTKQCRWENLTWFRDNQASGNVGYDCPVIDSGAVDGSVRVLARAQINGSFVCINPPNIEAGESLSFERGCVIKNTQGFVFHSGTGVLNVHGSGAQPVVFTSINDDDWGGDTDENGPTSGVAGQFGGVHIGGSQACRIEHALIRYGGANYHTGFIVDNPLAKVESVRVDHCYWVGMGLYAANGPLDNLVVFGCGEKGIASYSSDPANDIRFATVTNCPTGIALTGTAGLHVLSSIAWNNANNYIGATTANVFDSDGLPVGLVGVNGNMYIDPQFVDAANGDLHLQSTSPCIDAASFDLGKTVAGDHEESSRVNDHDLDGTVGADMGAYEFCNWNMSIAGRPVLGETMSFMVDGNPALVVLSLALLDYEYYYPPYGMVLVGSPFTLLLQDIWYVGYAYPVPIPNDPYAVGYQFGVQVGCAVYGNTGVGNIANLYRGVVEDI